MNPNEPDTPDAPAPEVEVAAAAPKPRKPRKPRAPKVAAPADAGDVGAADAGSPAVVDPSVDRAAPVESVLPVMPVPADDGPGEAVQAEGAGPEGGETVAEGQPEGEGRRRRRNRRRGRRGADRAGAADGSAEGDVDAAAAAPEGGDTEAESLPIEPLPPTDVNELFAEVVSGAYDVAEPEAAEVAAPAAPPRRVLAADPDAPKLHKVLAQSGVGSRRDLETMITEGRVTVNNQPAHIGQRISFGDRIYVDGKQVRVRIAPPPPRVIAYHKPVGEVVTHDDPQQRPTVFRRLPRLQQGKWQSVGRLDINTEGLLLFTNSGDLANRLMHPRFGVEREYAVRVLGTLTEDERAKLLEGVEIDGQTAAFQSIEDGGGEGVNHWYRVVITEGRNREVRKLMDSVGKAVSRLIRIRYGSVVLPRGLRRGVWVDLANDDVKALRNATGMARRDGPGHGPAAGAGPQDEKRGRRGGRRGRGGRREGDERMPQGQPREAGQDFDGDHEVDHIGPIPNPLQQTYDKRAIQQARKQREYSEDGPIPNPLQQTYDKRFAQGTGAKGGGVGRAGGGGGGAGGGQRPRRKSGGGAGGGQRASGAGGQPDPMRTSVGYIGADAFHNKGRGGRGGKGGGGGGRGGKGGPRR